MWDIALIEALLRPGLATELIVGVPRIHSAEDVEQYPDNPRRIKVYAAIDAEGMCADFWEAILAARRVP
jgi:purine nucleosidase